MLLLQLLLLQLLLDDDDTKGVAIIRSSIAAIIIDQHCRHNNETNDVDGRGLWNERKCMRDKDKVAQEVFNFVVIVCGQDVIFAWLLSGCWRPAISYIIFGPLSKIPFK